MNDWETKRKIAIVEADDFQDLYSRNGLNILFYWKAKYPNFKITLFTIPDRTSKEFFDLVNKHSDWIEFAMHGWNHESNYECWSWNDYMIEAYIKRVENKFGYPGFKKIFKAPGWQITDKYSGYIANETLPVAKDPQIVYKSLIKNNYIILDRHYNKPARPEGSKIVCVDCNSNIVHMHTWNMETGDINGRNGFQQVEEEHGVPWDSETTFKFISEAWNEGLFLPCKE